MGRSARKTAVRGDGISPQSVEATKLQQAAAIKGIRGMTLRRAKTDLGIESRMDGPISLGRVLINAQIEAPLFSQKCLRTTLTGIPAG
jgi:hypothetical protein